MLTAKERMNVFVAVVENSCLGRCPDPPGAGTSLVHCIDDYVRRKKGAVEIYDLHEWGKAEIRYALKVVRKLGFTPRWTE